MGRDILSRHRFDLSRSANRNDTADDKNLNCIHLGKHPVATLTEAKKSSILAIYHIHLGFGDHRIAFTQHRGADDQRHVEWAKS